MNTKTLLALAVLSLATLPQSPLRAGPDHGPRPLGEYAPLPATCIVIYDRAIGEYRVHNMEQCRERLSPCSTFKIPNALIGLETGMVSGPGDTRKWDGTKRSREVLNQDHDLASAIRHSVVWYFQGLARDIGPERMQAALDAWDYGNRDISGGQDRFWLSSSLQISALEQLEFMDKLDREALPASASNQAEVKRMMRQDENLPKGFMGELYGKTGSCISESGTPPHGWFAGFLHRGSKRYVCAVDGKGDGQWGWEARKIIVNILHDLH